MTDAWWERTTPADPAERDGLARSMDKVIQPEMGAYEAAVMNVYHASATFGISFRAYTDHAGDPTSKMFTESALDKLNEALTNVQRTRDALIAKIAKHFKNG